MLVSTSTTVALRCPICGKLDFYALSRFNIAGNNKFNIDCECGANLLSISRQKGKLYTVQIECNMCEAKHFYQYTTKELWSRGLLTIMCEETGVEIGFVGNREDVLKSVQNMDKSVQEMAEELGYGDFFNNPEIMYKVLEHLHSIADVGKLSCGCGNYNLDVEVYPDRMELHCDDCGAIGIVFAETFKDWETIQVIPEIVLTEGSYKYIDDKKHKKRKKRVKK